MPEKAAVAKASTPSLTDIIHTARHFITTPNSLSDVSSLIDAFNNAPLDDRVWHKVIARIEDTKFAIDNSVQFCPSCRTLQHAREFLPENRDETAQEEECKKWCIMCAKDWRSVCEVCLTRGCVIEPYVRDDDLIAQDLSNQEDLLRYEDELRSPRQENEEVATIPNLDVSSHIDAFNSLDIKERMMHDDIDSIEDNAFAIDNNVQLCPSCYTLQHAKEFLPENRDETGEMECEKWCIMCAKDWKSVCGECGYRGCTHNPYEREDDWLAQNLLREETLLREEAFLTQADLLGYQDSVRQEEENKEDEPWRWR